jgi:disulfide bond formation protein DsbB
MDLTSLVVLKYSVLTVLGQAIALALIVSLLLEWKKKKRYAIVEWCSRHALVLMFIVALLATGGSLYFSEIAGWTPCKDCWLQRIFMYPQVVLLAVALWKKDRHIAMYILVLSLIGIALSIDHYSDQVEAALSPADADPLQPCDATGESCAKTQIHFSFGYITIPMMAMTAFLLNIVGSITAMRRR